jgi:PAS domain S-box-containing protein
MSEGSARQDEHAFLSGGGRLGAIIAAFDWGATPLGVMAAWPQSLKTTVALILRSPVPIVTLWGEDGVMIYNDAYSGFAGGRHPRLLGSKVRQGWPEVASFNDKVMKVGLAGGTLAYQDQELTLFRNGVPERVWMNLDYSPIIDESGQPSGVIAIVVETTAKVLAEDAVLASETKFREQAEALAYLNATLEQQVAQRTAERDRMWRLSSDIMLVADFDSRIVAVNPAFTSVLGWTEQEVAGRSFLTLLHADDRDRTRAEMDSLCGGASTFRFENRYQRKDGGYSVLAWTAVPDEAFVHAVGRDITADREAAEALRRSEAALQQAQKMETIGKLTGGVAHDFNNLLQVISGNLQLLNRDVAHDPRAQRRVTNALAGVGRGAKLASQLLAFGRRQALEPKVVRIGRAIGGMEDMLRRSLGEAIEVETIVSGGLWNTFVDPAQVENAVLNLAINARDAMDGVGKLTIEVGNSFLDEHYARSHAEVVPGQYVMLAVTDTGTGMPPEVLAQVFEPFFSTKPEGKGTGLGLSMVYGFVKQSGGHVKIYSEVGYGTSVKLYLPRTLESEDMVTPVDAHPVVGGQETILVAEDDEQVRGTVVEMLAELGYSVLKANDAANALTIIESGIPIDLLFTDVVMPGPLRSPDLARKARERLPDLAVLFTSGYTENAIVHGGRLDAGVELLGKPYTGEALARKIRHVLANQKQRKHAGFDALPPAEARPAHLAAPLDGGVALKVLLVEDDDIIRANTAELLSELGHVVVEAASATQAIALIASASVDVLIADVGLPDMSGEQLARQVRELLPEIGVVFATGQDRAAPLAGAFLLRKPYDSIGIQAALAAVREARA